MPPTHLLAVSVLDTVIVSPEMPVMSKSVPPASIVNSGPAANSSLCKPRGRLLDCPQPTITSS